jgi:hypothetical protein
MRTPETASALLEFAGEFIHDIAHHKDVRTESLAEAFRDRFALSPFPSLADLRRVCQGLGIDLTSTSAMPPGLPGFNFWHESASPSILLGEDLTQRYAETTLGHELREVIENAFTRAKPHYTALDTANNDQMNAESDQFAGCLLMQAEASRKRLRELGFDYARFAQEIGRSLPSVVVRSRQLFPKGGPEPGPVMGLWIFEAPWELVEVSRSCVADLHMICDAHLSGFSARKSGTPDAVLARSIFPEKRQPAGDFRLIAQAIEARACVAGVLGGLDLFGERDFIIAAEPFFSGGSPWRVLLTAIRCDGRPQVEPWLARIVPGDDLPPLIAL